MDILKMLADLRQQREQIEQWLTERGDHLRRRPEVALHFAQPEDVDGAHSMLRQPPGN